MTTMRIDYAQDATGNYAVWMPTDHEVQDPSLLGARTRYAHASGRDYIPCPDREAAATLCAALRADAEAA